MAKLKPIYSNALFAALFVWAIISVVWIVYTIDNYDGPPKISNVKVFEKSFNVQDLATHIRCPYCKQKQKILPMTTIECKCGASIRFIGNRVQTAK